MHKLFFTTAAGIIASGMAHGQSINTVGDWDGSSVIGSFGANNGNTSTYGETFTSPGSSLENFTFYVNAEGGSDIVEAQVYQWSGSLLGGGGGRAVGPALFTSSPFSISNDSLSAVTVNAGGVALTHGVNYVALFTISDGANSSGSSVWGINLNSHLEAGQGDGGFVFYNNGDDIGLLNTTQWDNFADFGSLAWTANFGAPIPEPGSMALVAAGLAGLTVLRRRRAV